MDKICKKCGKLKGLNGFSKDSHNKSGIRAWCKECCNKAQNYRMSLDREKYNQISKEYRLKHPEECRERCTKYREKVKRETLTHYGHDKLECIKCGETRLPCLGLDHIDGNGSEEYRRLKRRGNGLYSYLYSRGFPKGYQTLCMNCNWIKRHKKGEYK